MDEIGSDEIERYHRQILLNEMNLGGQLKLKNSKVLVIGAGGLGSPILLYLSGAGIGTIGIVDGDTVEIINLHRQVIHPTSSVKLNKAESAKRMVLSLNPLITVETYCEWLTASSSREIVPKYDILVVATDNVESRYLISDLGVFYKKPVVSGSCVRWDGQLTVFNCSPCLRCLFPIPTPRKARSRAADVGVLGPIPGVIGTLQAVEVIKLILGLQVLTGKMMLYDGIAAKFRVFNTRGTDPNCPACSGMINPHEFNYSDLMGKAETPVESSRGIQPELLQKLIAQEVEIIDLRPKNHFDISHLPGSKNLPVHQIEEFDPFQNNKPLVFIDRNGVDASRVTEDMMLKGVECNFLLGGLDAWKEFQPSFLLF